MLREGHRALYARWQVPRGWCTPRRTTATASGAATGGRNDELQAAVKSSQGNLVLLLGNFERLSTGLAIKSQEQVTSSFLAATSEIWGSKTTVDLFNLIKRGRPRFLNPSHFEVAVESCQSAGDAASAVNIMRDMLRSGMDASRAVVLPTTQLVYRTGGEKEQRMFEATLDEYHVLNHIEVTEIRIREYIRQGENLLAWRLFQHVGDKSRTDGLYRLMIKCCGENFLVAKLKLLWTEITRKKPNNVDLYNAAIDAYLRMGRHLEARRLIKKLRVKLGDKPLTDETHARLLRVCVLERRPGSAVLIVKKHREELVPRLPRFAAEAVNLYADLGDFEECDRIVGEYKACNSGRSGRNVDLACAVIRARALRGDVLGARAGVLAIVKRANLNATCRALAAAMEGLGRAGERESAQGLLKEFADRGVKGSVPVFHALLEGHAHAGDARACAAAVKEMRAEHKIATPQALNLILVAMVRAGRLEDAERFYEDKLRWSLSAAHEILAGKARNGSVQDTLSWLATMRRNNLKPGEEAYAHVLALLEGEDELEELKRVKAEFDAQNLVLTEDMCRSLIRAFSRAGEQDQLDQLVKQMGEHQVPLTADMHLLLMRAHADGRDRARVEAMLQQIQAKGEALTAEHYALLVRTIGACGAGLPELEGVLSEMACGGLKPDAEVFTELLVACAKANESGAMQRYLLQAKLGAKIAFGASQVLRVLEAVAGGAMMAALPSVVNDMIASARGEPPMPRAEELQVRLFQTSAGDEADAAAELYSELRAMLEAGGTEKPDARCLAAYAQLLMRHGRTDGVLQCIEDFAADPELSAQVCKATQLSARKYMDFTKRKVKSYTVGKATSAARSVEVYRVLELPDRKRALELMDQAVKDDVPLSAAVFNKFLTSILEEAPDTVTTDPHKKHAARAVLAVLADRGLSARVCDVCSTYDLAQKSARMELFDQADAVFARLRETGVHPTKETFRAMIQIYGSGAKAVRKLLYLSSVVDKMRDAMIEPDASIYAAIIRAYTYNGAFEQAEATFQSTSYMKHFDLLNAYLHMLVESRQYAKAVSLFEANMAELVPVAPDDETVASYLMAHRGLWLEGPKLYNLVMEMEQKGLPVTHQIKMQLIEWLGETGDLDLVFHLTADILAQDPEDPVELFSIAIATVHEDDFDTQDRLIEHFRRRYRHRDWHNMAAIIHEDGTAQGERSASKL